MPGSLLVFCLQVMTEPELVERSEVFEAAIRGGDREALNTFCQAREQQVRSVHACCGMPRVNICHSLKHVALAA
jgi:hypothetical protein